LNKYAKAGFGSNPKPAFVGGYVINVSKLLYLAAE